MGGAVRSIWPAKGMALAKLLKGMAPAKPLRSPYPPSEPPPVLRASAQARKKAQEGARRRTLEAAGRPGEGEGKGGREAREKRRGAGG